MGDTNNTENNTNGKQVTIDNYKKENYPSVLYLPFYTITAEEIFKGNIALFDVDFFNPKQVYAALKDKDKNPDYYELTEEGKKFKEENLSDMDDKLAISHILNRYSLNNADTSSFTEEGKKKTENLKISETDFKKYLTFNQNKHAELSEVTDKSNIDYYYYLENGKEVRTSLDNTASALSGVISKWYKALRNIAIVLMMSILLYIGIRILLSTISSDKAKYKQMLMDWLIGICLLFLMHYIMAFSVTLTNQFIKVIATMDGGSYKVILEDDSDKLLSKGLKEMNMGKVIQDDGKIIWPTNLMGRMRIAAEMCHGKVRFIGFAICFLVLVFYTVFFSFTYLKRVIYLAFLTIMAPFVAMTYPIDKVNDGQAQGFNKWLKEYIFNLLIQPLHLLLYTMLVSSVFDFASHNVWYMLVAIGFLVPAEKLLRSLFGFEKATTPGSLAGAAVGAGLISSGMGKLLHKMPGDSHGKSGRNNRNLDDDNGGNGPRTNFNDDDFDATDALMGGTGLVEGSEDNASADGMERSNPELLNQNSPIGSLNPNEFQPNNLAYQNGQGQNLTFTDGNDANFNPLNSPNNAMSQLEDGANAMSQLGDGSNTIRPNTMGRNTAGQLDNITNYVNSARRKGRSKRSIRRALKAGARRIFTGKNIRRTLTNVGKKAIRTAGGATLAATAGVIGVAGGIASGDPSKVIQYGAAGIGGGFMAGTKSADAVMNTVGNGYDTIKNSETRRAMTEAYYGEDYKQKQQEKQIKEWKKNIEYKEELERAVGERKAKDMYKTGEIDEYLKHGVSDVSDMAAMHQLQEDRVASSIENAVAIHEYGERIGGDYSRLREKDKREWGETFSGEFQEKGYSKQQSDDASKATFDKIKQYHDIRKRMKTKL